MHASHIVIMAEDVEYYKSTQRQMPETGRVYEFRVMICDPVGESVSILRLRSGRHLRNLRMDVSNGRIHSTGPRAVLCMGGG